MNPWEQWSYTAHNAEAYQGFIDSALSTLGSDLAKKQEEAVKEHIAAAYGAPGSVHPLSSSNHKDDPGMTIHYSADSGAPSTHYWVDEMSGTIQQLMDVGSMSKEQAALYMGVIPDTTDTEAKPWKPNPKSAKGQDNAPLARDLIRLVPGLQTHVKGPCHCGQTGGARTVQDWIMHLNDSHIPGNAVEMHSAQTDADSYFWTRERIADWLDTLDVDLKVTEPGQEPWMKALVEAWEKGSLSAALTETTTVSAHVLDAGSKRQTRAQSVKAVEQAVRAILRKGGSFSIRVTAYPERWVIAPDGSVQYTENLVHDRDMEKVTAAAKALAEAMKPLGDQIKMLSDAVSKAIGDNQQFLAALSEAVKKEEEA